MVTRCLFKAEELAAGERDGLTRKISGKGDEASRGRAGNGIAQ